MLTINFWIGAFVLVVGIAALGRGRNWHDEAAGPRVPPERLGPIVSLFRSGRGPIAVAAIPIQAFGLFAVVAAALIMVGVVPAEQVPRLGVAVVVVGVFILTIASLLIRLVVWFGQRDRRR